MPAISITHQICACTLCQHFSCLHMPRLEFKTDRQQTAAPAVWVRPAAQLFIPAAASSCQCSSSHQSSNTNSPSSPVSWMKPPEPWPDQVCEGHRHHLWAARHYFVFSDLPANISLQSGIGEFIWRGKKSIPKKDFFVVDKYPNIFANWKPIQFFGPYDNPLWDLNNGCAKEKNNKRNNLPKIVAYLSLRRWSHKLCSDQYWPT